MRPIWSTYQQGINVSAWTAVCKLVCKICLVLQAASGNSSRGAEKALAEAQLVDLPNTGAFVLPLAAHSFLVGLLVIEQIVHSPDESSRTIASVVQPAQMSATLSGK